MINAASAVLKARKSGMVIPAFNIPYPEMAEPVAHAIIDENSVGMLMVARVEWEKFGAVSPEAIAKEYFKHNNDKILYYISIIYLQWMKTTWNVTT